MIITRMLKEKMDETKERRKTEVVTYTRSI